MTDLKKLYDAITDKRERYNLLSNYFKGKQPAIYLTERLREVFRGVDIQFTANLCSVVINSVDERINLTGFESSDKSAQTVLNDAWERSSIALEAADIHTDALVLGECYAIVWPGEDGKAEVYYNDPRMVQCVYAAENPRKITMAGKLWQGEDGKAKMTLYYPDRMEYYTSTVKFDSVSTSDAFQPDLSVSPTGTAANIYDQVPVFHFKVSRNCTSDLVDVIPLQNGTNKLLADMMVAAEFGAFLQRWVISQDNPGALKNAPNENWWIPAGDGVGQQAQVGQFQATDLKNYLDAIDRLAMSIGIITRTPKHYFFGQGGDPSGEALIAMEAPLNKKTQDRIDRFYPVWKQVALFICKIEGIAVAVKDITPQFDKPETVQPLTKAIIIKTNTESGIPLDTALTVAGWTDQEIETMNELKDAASTKAQTGLAGALLEAEKRMKTQPMPQGNNQPVIMPMQGVKQNV